ncbi:phosphate acetyltransferase [Flexivirga endophytica]|uniref:Phosphate acetyltransferase n=1 Tax=Flexivirga endophytica TaxID=1849103 RepID=A0A916WSH1_9MICO|nr:phosphotransacetylase [Flexivirga endophytica]GGB30430.1 phosphate acetyltransferase [Flexivirga endophytica]GHB51335.1 phosphate acetyltransferase [Flexivirga endophytica]
MTEPLSSGWVQRLIDQRAAPTAVVLTEGEDQRVRQAASQLTDLGVRPILVGRWRADLSREVECRSVHELHTATVATRLDTLAARKEWSAEKRQEAGADPLLVAACSVGSGEADAAVAGAVSPSGDVIRAALRGIGLAPGTALLSSCFLLELGTGVPVAFADCAVVPEPDSEGLADIALSTARTFGALADREPVVAMLSFSTGGSADHPTVRLVREATALALQRDPSLRIDGELQFDAAFIPSVAASKAPDSTVAGEGNVFVFPNLAAGNIGYKIAERIGNASAYGPILQGLRAPMNDLSRGCSTQDVVNVSLISALQAAGADRTAVVG